MDIVLCILLVIAAIFIYKIILIIILIKVFGVIPKELEEDDEYTFTHRKYYDNDEYDYGHNITHNIEDYD